MANGGQGIGRWGDKTIFLPYVIPGETVTARLVDDRGRYAFGEGIAVLDPSLDRVLPLCPHFGAGRCGGCLWQHIDYPAQLALKTDIVADQLSRIAGLDDAPVQMAIASPQIWRYSHEAVLLPDAAGKLGLLSTDGQTPISISECHIITPALFSLIEQLDFDLPSLKRVVLRDNGAGDLMLILSTTDDEAPQLEVDFKASVNFLLSDDEMSDGEPANLIGATHLNYTINGGLYRVTAGSYIRPNLSQLANLGALIQSWAGLTGAESVLSLYSGVGLWAGLLAPYASLITCIDPYPPAMTDAESNLSAFEHVNLIEGAADEVLYAVPDDESYDLAIIDAPLGGLPTDVIDALGEVLPPRLLYIGDDPAILARDVKRLGMRYNYRLRDVQPLDFAPQTPQITSLIELQRD